jgi:steroid delta-isomerase-like uncharacterized protein
MDGDPATVLTQYYEAFNRHDVDAIIAFVAADAVLAAVPKELGLGQDRDAFAEYLQMNFTAFPDLHLGVLDMAVGEDLVAARVRGTGTHEGNFMGVRPQGRSVDEEFAEFFRLDADQRITRFWSYYDKLSFMQQLGIVPSGGERVVRAASIVLAAVRGRRRKRSSRPT